MGGLNGVPVIAGLAVLPQEAFWCVFEPDLIPRASATTASARDVAPGFQLNSPLNPSAAMLGAGDAVLRARKPTNGGRLGGCMAQTNT